MHHVFISYSSRDITQAQRYQPGKRMVLCKCQACQRNYHIIETI